MLRRTPTLVASILALFAVALLAGAPPAQGQDPIPAWTLVEEGLEFGAPEAIRSRVAGARTVRSSFAQLDALEPGDTLRLDLTAQDVAVVEIQSVSRDRFNGHVIHGAVAGDPTSRAILVLEPDGLAGSIVTGSAHYEVRWIGEGLSSVMQNDPARRRGDEVVYPPAGAVPESPRVSAPTAASANTTFTWDVVHVYPKSVANQLGGTGAVKAAAKVAFAAWNLGLANSGVKAEVRMVANKKVGYSPTGTTIGYANQALDDLRTGVVKKSDKFKSKFGADIMSMAIPINDVICGLGYVPGSGNGLTAGHGAVAYHVNSADCLAGFGGRTMAHEGGHNVGLNHDADNARQSDFFGAFLYSFGWRVAGEFRTIMAYSCGFQSLAECGEVDYFSNPKKKLNGKRLGSKNKADNAKSQQNTREVVANWNGCRKACNGVNS